MGRTSGFTLIGDCVNDVTLLTGGVLLFGAETRISPFCQKVLSYSVTVTKPWHSVADVILIGVWIEISSSDYPGRREKKENSTKKTSIL